MTIPVQTIYNNYTANGLTTVFAYGFKITAAEDLKVTVDGVVITTGITIGGVGVETGGDVTFGVAPLNNQIVLLELDPIVKRDTDYPQFGDIPFDVINKDFDRLVLMFQKFLNDTSRSLKLPVDTGVDQVITDNAAARAGKGVKFDASGNLILSSQDPDANAASAAAVLGDIAPAIHIATNKATPVDADEMLLIDSASAFSLKKLTWANLKTVLAAACSAGWNAATATTALNTTNTNGQIPFPATQNPSANANTLDDYEEGTWTPTLGGTATYNAGNNGTYTKIGRMVHVTGLLSVNSIGTGQVNGFGGLPFAKVADGIPATGVMIWTSGAVSPVYCAISLSDNQTAVNYYGATAASATLAGVSLNGAATTVRFSLSYCV